VLIMLIMIAVGFWVTAILITLSRTMIPYGYAGETVINVMVHHEHLPGRDDMIMVRTDRRTLRVDPNAADCVKVGDRVTKAAWSRTVTGSSGASCTLGWPKQLRTVVVVPLLVAAGAGGLLLLARLRLRRLVG
jgi:hypothetical protein